MLLLGDKGGDDDDEDDPDIYKHGDIYRHVYNVIITAFLITILFDQNFCGIGLEYRVLQSSRRKATG